MEDCHFWGTGWSFPPTFQVGNHQLVLKHKENNINRSIDVMLQTMKGERSLQPSFGSGLRKFLFQEMNETLKGEIREEVFQTLLHNEPRIIVDEIQVEFPQTLDGQVQIHIFYTVRKTNTRHNHVFPFSLREGTDL